MLYLSSLFLGLRCIAQPLVEHDCHPLLVSFTALVFTCLLILSAMFFYRTSLGDPGFLPEKLEQPVENQLQGDYNHTCKLCHDKWQPPRAYHCDLCGRCVFKVEVSYQMENHYLWLCNCVGVGNMKFFLLFLMFTGFACLAFSILAFMAAFNMADSFGAEKIFFFEEGTTSEKVSQIYQVIIPAILLYLVLGLLLAYFSYDLYDFTIQGIDHNQTTVENIKESYGVKVYSLDTVLFGIFESHVYGADLGVYFFFREYPENS